MKKERQKVTSGQAALDASNKRLEDLKAQNAQFSLIEVELKRNAQLFNDLETAQKSFNKVQSNVNKNTAANKKE